MEANNVPMALAPFPMAANVKRELAVLAAHVVKRSATGKRYLSRGPEDKNRSVAMYIERVQWNETPRALASYERISFQASHV